MDNSDSDDEEYGQSVEQLEPEACQLRQSLVEKQDEEKTMVQVLLRMEQEQKVTEEARLLAEQNATSQKYESYMLQDKYEETTVALAQMEKRAVTIETMLEAIIQYQSSSVKAKEPPSSPRKVGLLSRPFGHGRLDKKKGKPEETTEETPRKFVRRFFSDSSQCINSKG